MCAAERLAGGMGRRSRAQKRREELGGSGSLQPIVSQKPSSRGGHYQPTRDGVTTVGGVRLNPLGPSALPSLQHSRPELPDANTQAALTALGGLAPVRVPVPVKPAHLGAMPPAPGGSSHATALESLQSGLLKVRLELDRVKGQLRERDSQLQGQRLLCAAQEREIDSLRSQLAGRTAGGAGSGGAMHSRNLQSPARYDNSPPGRSSGDAAQRHARESLVEEAQTTRQQAASFRTELTQLRQKHLDENQWVNPWVVKGESLDGVAAMCVGGVR